ncbi:MAG: 30S ribosomal protein S6 [Clostridia bacterium]|nr:30S ribosomal protein S6 [Clostridia bacterium]
MEKICSYETLFVISGNCSEEEYNTLKEKFVNLVNENATDVTVNEWGKRRLAYAINYITEGYYVLLNFKSEPSFPRELTRVFGITEGIIRNITLAVEAKAEASEAAEEVAVEETVEVEETTEA